MYHVQVDFSSGMTCALLCDITYVYEKYLERNLFSRFKVDITYRLYTGVWRFLNCINRCRFDIAFFISLSTTLSTHTLLLLFHLFACFAWSNGKKAFLSKQKKTTYPELIGKSRTFSTKTSALIERSYTADMTWQLVKQQPWRKVNHESSAHCHTV